MQVGADPSYVPRTIVYPPFVAALSGGLLTITTSLPFTPCTPVSPVGTP